MEVPRGNERKPLVAAYEMLGCAIFIYMILVSTGEELVVPLALFICILIFGGITGGHFNPAVTLGVYVNEGKYKENAMFCILIITSQLIGGLIGMMGAKFTLSANIDGDFKVPAHSVPVLAPKDPTGKADHDMGDDGFTEDWQVFFTQVMCTFIFVSTVLMVKGKFTTPSNDGALLGLAVVLVLFGLIKVANHAAASFNPTITLALTLFQNMCLDNTGGYLTHYFYAYFTGPMVGGIVAGAFHRLHASLHEPEQKKQAGLPAAGDEESNALVTSSAQ